MTSKQFLERARDIEIVINALKEQKTLISYVRSPIATTISQHNGEVSDRTGKMAIRIAELTEEIENYEKEALELRAEILKVIMRVPKNSYRALLIERYINCRKWEEVAEKIGYSFEYVRKRLRPAALKEFDIILNWSLGK